MRSDIGIQIADSRIDLAEELVVYGLLAVVANAGQGCPGLAVGDRPEPVCHPLHGFYLYQQRQPPQIMPFGAYPGGGYLSDKLPHENLLVYKTIPVPPVHRK